MKNLSIVIPAYNEMRQTIRSFNTYLLQTSFFYEIIIAGDGSTDNTVDLVRKLQLEILDLRLLILAKNKGKGKAVKTGMLAAKGNIRLFSDADGSTPIKELKRVINPVLNGKSKIAIDSRYLKESTVLISQPFYRREWNSIANRFVQRLSLLRIVDPNCEFKAFDGKTAAFIFSKCIVNEWLFDLEVVGIARKYNIPIAEVRVLWKNDERTKVKLSYLPQEIKNLFTIRKRIKQIKIAY